MRLVLTTSLCALAPLLFTGCGGSLSLHPVKGMVKFADGTPVPHASILLTPVDGAANPNLSCKGTVKDGAFTIMTGDKEGAPAGKYKVSFSSGVDPSMIGAGKVPNMADMMKRVVAAKYEDPAKTPLEKEVTSGTNEWNDLSVEKPGPGEEMMGPSEGGPPAGLPSGAPSGR